MSVTDFIDPFHGNGTIDLPTPAGLAGTWFFPKAQTGNTHPGACVPFGMVSACPTHGAYVTGYGVNPPNSHGTITPRFDRPGACGVTHFHPSGAGALGCYGNHFRVTPLTGDTSAAAMATLGTTWPLIDETARPGYYAATLGDADVTVGLTVSRTAAFHRYRFDGTFGRFLALDITVGGLAFDGFRNLPSAGTIACDRTGRCAAGHIVVDGMTVYFAVAAVSSNGVGLKPVLWRDRKETAGGALSYECAADRPDGMGALFAVPDATVELRIAFSLDSSENALQNLDAAMAVPFDQQAAAAQSLWEKHCGVIAVEAACDTTPGDIDVFYSNCYHSLVKPIDCRGRQDADAWYLDFATLWDQYKTQLPLVMTFWPERAAGMVNSLLNEARTVGEFPNSVLLSVDRFQHAEQARCLAHHVIVDAWHRGIGGIDYHAARDLMVADVLAPRHADFVSIGTTRRATFTLDMAAACFATAQLCTGLNDTATAERMMVLADRWRHVYDPATGVLTHLSPYYEGTLWNYSFRLLHNMADRIALAGGDAGFVALLEKFFGFDAVNDPPVTRDITPGDTASMQRGFALGRFEGFNNEPDMETPYAFIYAGRPDRTAEILRAAGRYQFTTGRGGLPGNDDSGGLSSCYVWNAIGLFPVTTMPVMLIGSGLYERVTLSLPGGTFTITWRDNSDSHIYVQSATLNGRPLDRAWLRLDEFIGGGELIVTMGDTPSDWATGLDQRPPSWPS